MNLAMFLVIFQILTSVFSPFQQKENNINQVHQESIQKQFYFFDTYQCELDYENIPGKDNFLEHMKRNHTNLFNGFELLDEKQKEFYINKQRNQ